MLNWMRSKLVQVLINVFLIIYMKLKFNLLDYQTNAKSIDTSGYTAKLLALSLCIALLLSDLIKLHAIAVSLLRSMNIFQFCQSTSTASLLGDCNIQSLIDGRIQFINSIIFMSKSYS